MAAEDTASLLTEEQGQLLIRLARKTIAESLGKKMPEAEWEKELSKPPFTRHSGTFVTLNKNRSLRGCIGCLTTEESIAEGVRRNAANAAFCDPRFRPLSAAELDDITIEISVLTEPQPLSYTDADDLKAKLRVKVDGVILGKGGSRATFLPQVWDQLPNSDDFLTSLCRKASIPGDSWKKSRLDISTYQVQYFEET